jgi:hypothetical protein
MAKKYPKPFLKPRELKKLEESQWAVEAEWPDGAIEQIGRFSSEQQAQDWIATDAAAWLGEREPRGA